MTNKLHCPFCGAELENGNSWSYYCTNSFCEHSDFCGTLEMWQALIRGKAAQDALEGGICGLLLCEEKLDKENLDRLDILQLKSLIHRIKEIASITTQEKE